MSAPAHDDQAHPEDPIEAVTKYIPVVIPVAGAIILVSWLLTGWYVRTANRDFDRLSSALLEELK